MAASPTRLRFENACGEIGGELADLGFRYLKSKRLARKVTGEWTQVVSFQSSMLNTPDNVKLWVWYWIDSERVHQWRQQHGAVGNAARVFGCGLGYLGNPATFVDWDVAGDVTAVVRDVVTRVRSGTDRISNVVMDVPTFLDRISESDLTFFNPGDVVDLLAAHDCGDQIADYLRRLAGGLQSTSTVRKDGTVIIAAARRHLADTTESGNAGAAELARALSRADRTHLLDEVLGAPGDRPSAGQC